MTALSWISTFSEENETRGSAGRSASMTRSSMVTPLGSSQDASLTEFGCSQVSRTPPSTSGGLGENEF